MSEANFLKEAKSSGVAVTQPAGGGKISKLKIVHKENRTPIFPGKKISKAEKIVVITRILKSMTKVRFCTRASGI